jgi:hypothetical protein
MASIRRIPRLRLRAPLALLLLFTSGVNRRPLEFRCIPAIGLAMFDHLKIVSISIGLLVVLAGLCNVSFATAQEKAPAKKSTAVLAVTLQSAQGRVAAGGAFRAIAFSY